MNIFRYRRFPAYFGQAASSAITSSKPGNGLIVMGHASASTVPTAVKPSSKSRKDTPHPSRSTGNDESKKKFGAGDRRLEKKSEKSEAEIKAIAKERRIKDRRELSRQWNAAMPIGFKEKLETWPKLLQKEIDQEVQGIERELDEDRKAGVPLNSAIVGLRYHSCMLDPLKLKADVTFDQSGASRRTDRTSPYKPGMPLTLFRQTDEHLIPVCDCILLSMDADSRLLTVRLLNESSESAMKRGSTRGESLEINAEIKKYKDNCLFVLRKSSNVFKLNKLKNWLTDWQTKFAGKPGQEILECAHRVKPMPTSYSDSTKKLKFTVKELNESQKIAVAMAMNNNRPFVTIQGPPGTGKTVVVAEIVRQAIRDGQKVLVCAPSNMAVDNIMNRMAGDVATTRFGFGERDMLSKDIRAHERYKQLATAGVLLVNRLSQELGDRRVLGDLYSQFYQISEPLTETVLQSKQVIFSTIGNGLMNTLLPLHWVPDLVVMDEAGQSMECESWVPIMNGKRCVLAGDHCQLPCVVRSTEAITSGLGISLLEAMTREFGGVVSQMLNVQYRMNERIMQWSSDFFYESKLISDASNAQLLLSDICSIKKEDVMNQPLLLIDTDQVNSSADRRSFQETRVGNSFQNIGEARLVASHVRNLLQSGVRPGDIGIISPYDAQVRAIRQILPIPDLNVNSVDGFQGQEREVIVLSMVRNNKKGAIGFLNDERRLNVAVTRARRQFVCIASGTTMEDESGFAKHLKSLKETIGKLGVILPAEQFLDK